MKALEADSDTKNKMNIYKDSFLKICKSKAELEYLIPKGKHLFHKTITEVKENHGSMAHTEAKDSYFGELEQSLVIAAEVKEALEKGITFYSKIHQYILTLKMSIYDFANLRSQEREEAKS